MPIKELPYQSPTEASSGSLRARNPNVSKDSGVPVEHRRWTDRLAQALTSAPIDTRNLIVTELNDLKNNRQAEFEIFSEKMLEFCAKPKNNSADIINEALIFMNIKR